MDQMRSARFRPILSVVVPVYNEAANVAAFLDRTLRVLQALNRDFELLFVDDGSCDETASRITAAAVDCPAVRLVRLSRNFGHQAALVAGLAQARGAAVITMDGDLQHPPELIPQLVAAWDAGADVVQAVRRAPVDDSPLKRAGSRAFYRLLSAVSRLAVTPGASDFRLMSRPAVDAFLACPERCRFNRGLVHWIGFTRDEILYEAATRHAGRSKYSWSAMIRLAGDAIFSFSSVPLRLAGLAGACVSVVATFYLLFVLGAYFFTDRTVAGWASTLAAVLVLGGVNLTVMWILGEYVGRLYEEVKQRPIYIVRPEGRADAQSGAEREEKPEEQPADRQERVGV